MISNIKRYYKKNYNNVYTKERYFIPYFNSEVNNMCTVFPLMIAGS